MYSVTEREREWRGGGRGECFHWPLECVSNIFQVCSGKSLSLCASAPSFCVRVAAGTQHPAALLRKRDPVTLPTPSYNLQTSAFQYCIRSGPKKKKGQCRDQVVKLQGARRGSVVSGPQNKAARFSTADSRSTPGAGAPKLFMFQWIYIKPKHNID